MPEQVFPPVDRVVYGKAPIVEVICQVRFPADLRIDAEPPAAFQQRIREHFPLLQAPDLSVPAAMPPEVARTIVSAIPKSLRPTIWQFNSEDGSHALELLKDNVTLISRDYRRWESFFGLFGPALAAVSEIYRPPFFTRVGLRYRDVIRRSKLGLTDTRWSTLLKPQVLGEMSQATIEDRTLEVSRNLLLKLPEHDAKVRLQHGFVDIGEEVERSYLIDCDFFVDRTEVASAGRILDYFHSNAFQYFRGCITDELHQAMEPQRIP